MDILECSPIDKIGKYKMDSHAIGNFMRFRQIYSWANGNHDVYEFMQAYPDVNFRYYVEPEESLVEGMDELRFDNATVTWPMQVKGRADGQKTV